MSGVRVPFRRQHTGTFEGDAIQRPAQAAAVRAEAVATTLGTVSDCHGVGMRLISLTDADYKPTSTDLSYAFLVFTGTLTAGRTIVLPKTTDAKAFGRWVKNATSGGFTLTLKNDNGSTTVTSGSKRFVVVSSTYGVEAYV